MDIYDPSARINEAIAALEDNNLFRAKLLSRDNLNKEQIKYLTSNPEVHAEFLSIVKQDTVKIAPESSMK